MNFVYKPDIWRISQVRCVRTGQVFRPKHSNSLLNTFQDFLTMAHHTFDLPGDVDKYDIAVEPFQEMVNKTDKFTCPGIIILRYCDRLWEFHVRYTASPVPTPGKETTECTSDYAVIPLLEADQPKKKSSCACNIL